MAFQYFLYLPLSALDRIFRVSGLSGAKSLPLMAYASAAYVCAASTSSFLRELFPALVIEVRLTSPRLNALTAQVRDIKRTTLDWRVF